MYSYTFMCFRMFCPHVDVVVRLMYHETELDFPLVLIHSHAAVHAAYGSTASGAIEHIDVDLLRVEKIDQWEVKNQ